MAIIANRIKQKGFALIFVLVFVAMIMGIVGDIVYQTQVGARSSIEERNKLDAQTAALTGVEFAKLLLSLSILAEKYQNNPLIPLPKNMYSMLNGQPIGASGLESLEELSGAKLSKAISKEILSALKVMPGYFVLNINSENAKFNLNLLQSNFSNEAQKALKRIFSTPDSKKFLATLELTPQQLVDNLTSYIKISNTNAYLRNVTQVDYNNINAKYKPKNAALESLEELRRIPGFHLDDIYNVFSPYFTIWPIIGGSGTLNINSAPIELIATLLTPENMDPNSLDWDNFEMFRLKNDFNKSTINDWLTKNLSDYKENTDSLNITKNFIGTKDTIFKVESRGVVNGVEQTLVIVLQQETVSDQPSPPQPNQNNENQSDQQQNNPKNQTQSSPNFTILYSGWK